MELDEQGKATDDLESAIRLQPNSSKLLAERAELLLLSDTRRDGALADINRAWRSNRPTTNSACCG